MTSQRTPLIPWCAVACAALLVPPPALANSGETQESSQESADRPASAATPEVEGGEDGKNRSSDKGAGVGEGNTSQAEPQETSGVESVAGEGAAVEAGAATPAAPGSTATESGPAVPAAPPPFEVVGDATEGMGTHLQVLVYTDQKGLAVKAIAAGFVEMRRIEALMSEWLAGSDVSRINRAAGNGKWIPIARETFIVLSRGQEISGQAQGRFATTWAALAPLWDLAAGQALKVPSRGAALEKAAMVDDTSLLLQDAGGVTAARLKRRGMALGLGGIAKGYAADRGLDVVKKAGFENVLVFAGGDVAFSGSKGAKPWLVGIQDPGGLGFFATIRSSGIGDAIVTSGDYERFVEIAGKRYHHILDPTTGFPATGIRSVTIVAKDAMSADALSTAVFVLGQNNGLRLVESLAGVECVIVTDKNEVVVSTGIASRLRVLRQPTAVTAAGEQ